MIVLSRHRGTIYFSPIPELMFVRFTYDFFYMELMCNGEQQHIPSMSFRSYNIKKNTAITRTQGLPLPSRPRRKTPPLDIGFSI